MLESERDIVDVEGPIRKLQFSDGEIDPSLTPDVIEFGRFISTRLNGGDIVPHGFVMVASLAQFDLSTGVNGFTGEQIDNPLVGKSAEAYSQLFASVPTLARIAFPESFAEQVEKIWSDIDKAMKKDQRPLPFSEAVESDVHSIEEARRLIIDPARARVLAMDWERFGVTDMEDLGNLFDTVMPICLRQSLVRLPLNILRSRVEKEQKIIDFLPGDHKEWIQDVYWLAMLTDTISSPDAALTRDAIFLKTSDVIIGMKDLPVDEVVKHFFDSNPDYAGALQRYMEYIEYNPHKTEFA